MRAIVCPRYGPPDVLVIREVPTPVPGPQEVRGRVFATTVTSGDWRVRSGIFPRGFVFIAGLAVGIGGPREPILGTELAGVVDAVGDAVTRFKVGDAVFGFGDTGMRCHAEYRCFAEDGLIAPKPANLTLRIRADREIEHPEASHAEHSVVRIISPPHRHRRTSPVPTAGGGRSEG